MLARIEANMTPEQKARLQHFADIMQKIEDEITAQGLDAEPIKAQVIFMCALGEREESDTLYSDFVSCFADGADDETVFANISAAFGVSFTAEEKEKILLLCEKAVESQTVPPSALHNEIGSLLAGDSSPAAAERFASPFHDRDWQSCLTSGYGNRKDPITGENAKHAGLDLAAPEGTAIYPSKPGKVLLVRWDENGYGNYIVISHGGGQATLYGHCSAILATAGDEVTTDTVIARVGSTGKSTGNHLHFEIIVNGKPVNPKKYLGASTP
jgi:murein DD-endopeptidase MepM/ murein hydrolase activator NlpD